jgi:two-component system response regulator QseB
MRLLLVEDNERLAGFVAVGLAQAGFAVDSFGTLGEAEAALSTTRYEAIVLDLGLPDGDGIDLLKRLRQGGDATPLLLLTARDGIGDRVAGLNAGADDYLVKPFASEELVARLRALLRRPTGVLGTVLTFEDVAFDTVARETRVRGEVLLLSRRETDLLEHLVRRAGRVVSKTFLEEALYGFADEASSNSVEATMSRLRKRLQASGAGVAVHTVRGLGYLLAAEGECGRAG